MDYKEYNEEIVGYCSYCKEAVYKYENYRFTDNGVMHNDEANNCYEQSSLMIDDFGDNEFDEC